MGEKRTKPNHLNISERQRYLMRREKKCDCLCPLSGRAGAELEELMRSRFILVGSFSCYKLRKGQNRAWRFQWTWRALPCAAHVVPPGKGGAAAGAQLITRYCQ